MLNRQFATTVAGGVIAGVIVLMVRRYLDRRQPPQGGTYT